MKVLHLLTRFHRRGAEVFALELFRELDRLGVEGKLVSLFPGEDQIGATECAGGWLRLEAPGLLAGVVRLREVIRRECPDLILAHGGKPLQHAVLARGRRPRPRLVYKKISSSTAWLAGRPWALPWHRWFTARADAIVPVSEALGRELEGLFRVDPGKVRMIPNGRDAGPYDLPEDTGPAVRRELGIRPAAPVLIAVGALSWEKNQDAMIRALGLVRAQFPDALLLLAGEGPCRESLESRARERGLAGAVRFLGLRPDVPSLLAAADILLLSSLTEGLPGVLIEAGLAGRPCVSWDVGGVREVVRPGETGLVTPPGDDAAFAAGILDLLRDGVKAARMGQAARDVMRRDFDIRRSAGRYRELFLELTSSHE